EEASMGPARRSCGFRWAIAASPMIGARASARTRIVAMLAAMVASGGLVVPSAATGAPASASITLKPNIGPPTARVLVTGSGFGMSEGIVITFDAQQVGVAGTDE